MSIGTDDIVDLLHFSLTSSAPFTNLLRKKTWKKFIATKDEPRLLFPGNPFGDWTSTRKMVLKIFLQRSNDRFLFAEASHDFAVLLLSILFVHLGVVGCHIYNIGNLHMSVAELIDNKYFSTSDAKTKLVETRSKSLNDLLIMWSKGEGGEKIETKYIVTDDLTLKPSTVTSSIPFLNKLGVSLYDVKEMDIEIGVTEVAKMMVASLSSKTVLTDTVVNPMLNKSSEYQKTKQ